jgi:hypothetical protein
MKITPITNNLFWGLGLTGLVVKASNLLFIEREVIVKGKVNSFTAIA